VLRLSSMSLGMGRKRMGIGMLGVGGALAASLGFAAPALADISVTPSGSCSRPGFGGFGAWTCQVPTTGGAFATVSGIPADLFGGVDLTALNTWTAANLGTGAIALGDLTTKASGANAVAVGKGAQAVKDGAIAIGLNAVAGDAANSYVNQVAIGANAKATAQNSTAVGDAAIAQGPQSTAYGSNARATAAQATALGRSAE
ncbi:hypothetical protein AB4Z23_27845, partial [Agrobacterium sp. MCAB5]